MTSAQSHSHNHALLKSQCIACGGVSWVAYHETRTFRGIGLADEMPVLGLSKGALTLRNADFDFLNSLRITPRTCAGSLGYRRSGAPTNDERCCSIRALFKQ